MFFEFRQQYHKDHHILLAFIYLIVLLWIIILNLKIMERKVKNVYSLKTDKKNRIVVEEIQPNELKEIWDKLTELNKSL